MLASCNSDTFGYKAFDYPAQNSKVSQFLTLLKDPEVQAYFLSLARLETSQRIQEDLL
jgi:hypothetical protein